MLIWGWKTHAVNLEHREYHHCATCGRTRKFQAVVQYRLFHLYWLLGFIAGKRYMMLCDVCRLGWYLDADRIEPFLEKRPIPLLHQYGLFGSVIAIAIIGTVIWQLAN